MVSGKSAPCSSSGIGAFCALDGWSKLSLRLDGLLKFGFGELLIEGIREEGELILCQVTRTDSTTV